MSKIRGVFPLFLATTFGIVNGIWVFGPAFKEQQEQKIERAKKALEISSPEDKESKILRNAEAAASQSSATEAALKPVGLLGSWWPNMGLWSKEASANSKSTHSEIPRDNQEKKDAEKR